ncbi:hypothetical protein ACI2LJ_37405 [Streptomyces sp. NPDC088090]|uniref:hypothetical protein n=1 Tax=Streptomyces sp. NPDC088090 TaxID=3365822 RepID=UPI00384F4690
MAYVSTTFCAGGRGRACSGDCPAEHDPGDGATFRVRPDHHHADRGSRGSARALTALFHDDDLPGDWSAVPTAEGEVFVQFGSLHGPAGRPGSRTEPFPAAEPPLWASGSAAPPIHPQES